MYLALTVPNKLINGLHFIRPIPVICICYLLLFLSPVDNYCIYKFKEKILAKTKQIIAILSPNGNPTLEHTSFTWATCLQHVVQFWSHFSMFCIIHPCINIYTLIIVTKRLSGLTLWIDHYGFSNNVDTVVVQIMIKFCLERFSQNTRRKFSFISNTCNNNKQRRI